MKRRRCNDGGNDISGDDGDVIKVKKMATSQHDDESLLLGEETLVFSVQILLMTIILFPYLLKELLL